jgi:xylulokinase
VGLFWLADTRDIDRVRWHTGLMARLGLDPARFPPLLRSIDVLGPLADGAADALGLPRGTPVVAGAADLQSCCVGSGAVRDGEAHLYVGTSSWVLYHTPRRRLDALHSIASLPSAIPGRYFVATEQDMAGGALEFALRNLGLGTGPEGFAAVEAALANTAPGAAGVLFTPWLNGEKTPVDDESLRGGFHGLGVATTRDDLLRAVVEGVALNARWLLLHLDRLAGGRLDPLNAVGGGVQSDGWSQVYADVLGRTVRRVRHPRAANARGAAWIAAVGLGRLRFDDLPALVRFDGVFEPRPAHRAVYDDAFRRFLRAWKATRAIR